MITSVPNQNVTRAPRLNALMKYLVNDANHKREETILINGFGESIVNSEAYYKNYWHGIMAPSSLECNELSERYPSDDCRHAAIEHGKELVSQLQTKLGFDKDIAIAIHWRKQNDGTTYWHYHLVGLGEPAKKLHGKDGALHDAWYFASITKDKPIVNALEHKLEMEKIGELVVIDNQLRQLARDRREAIKAATPEDKMAVRTSFNKLETKLINKRFILKQARIDHQYAARATSGSISHQIAHQNNSNERAASLARMTDRGQSLAVKIANKRATRNLAATHQRAVIKTIKAAYKDKKINTLTKTKVTQVATKIASKTTKVAAVSIATAATTISKQATDPEVNQDQTKEVAKAPTNITTAAIVDAAKLAAQAAVARVKRAVTSVTAMLPKPKLGALTTNHIQNDNTSSLTSNDHSNPTLTKFELALAKARANSYDGRSNQARTDASEQSLALSAPVIAPTQTITTVAKDIMTLSPIKTTTDAVTGSLTITKQAVGALDKGAKELPKAIKLPLQVANQLPVVGGLANTLTIAAETSLTASAVNDHSDDFEVER